MKSFSYFFSMITLGRGRGAWSIFTLGRAFGLFFRLGIGLNTVESDFAGR